MKMKKSRRMIVSKMCAKEPNQRSLNWRKNDNKTKKTKLQRRKKSKKKSKLRKKKLKKI